MKHLLQLALLLAFQITMNAQTVSHYVEVSGMTFTPPVLLINQGDTVHWENISGLHNVNGTQAMFPGNAESFTSGAPAAAPWSYEHIFTVPGTNNYMCDVHGPTMSGSITVNTPLPVELNYLTTSVHNSEVQVSWESAVEINLSHYVLQRSLNGLDFNDISHFGAQQQKARYEYTDKLGIAQQFYYRLQMVDVDGQFKYSPIVMAVNDVKYNYNALSLYPNPFIEQFRITLPSETNWNGLVEIYNMSGSLMMSKEYQISEGVNNIDLNLAGLLPAGLYVVAVRDRLNHKDIMSATVLKQ